MYRPIAVNNHFKTMKFFITTVIHDNRIRLVRPILDFSVLSS